MPKSKPNILDSTEVAALLNVSKRHVRRLASAQRIRSFKLAGNWFFHRSAVEHYRRQPSQRVKYRLKGIPGPIPDGYRIGCGEYPKTRKS